MWFIYTLRDQDNVVRYVGQTRDVKRRLAQHVSKARRTSVEKRTPVLSWIAELLASELLPVLGKSLRVAETREQADAIERELIDEHRASLLNCQSGGIIGHTLTSTSTREKMANGKRGSKQSPETIERRRRKMMGHSVSAETREKIAASKRGKPRDAATREKIAASLRGKPNPHASETMKKLRLNEEAMAKRRAGHRAHFSKKEKI
jgi:hypothetical protein